MNSGLRSTRSYSRLLPIARRNGLGNLSGLVTKLKMADAEPLMGRLLQYRFPGQGPATRIGSAAPSTPDAEASLSPGLGGHAVGNLLLAALVALEDGDFEEGVREMNRVLAVRGRVVPATGTSPDPAEIMAWAREHMANYKAPRAVHIVDALPFNAGGKVMKFELRARLEEASS